MNLFIGLEPIEWLFSLKIEHDVAFFCANTPSQAQDLLGKCAAIGTASCRVHMSDKIAILFCRLCAGGHKKTKLVLCRPVLNAPQTETVIIEASAAFMHRVAQIDITCGTCSKTGHGHVAKAIVPNISHAPQILPSQTHLVIHKSDRRRQMFKNSVNFQ